MTHGKNIRTSKPTSTSSPLSTGLLQRKCACGQYMVAGEECAECVKKKNSLQRKLTIGASNDPLELEADRVADQVMRMPDSKTISTIPTMSRLQRQANSESIVTTTAPNIINDVLNSSGQQLTPPTRAFFEPRFGQDFSHVRIHTNHQAVKSAEALSASAYTMGSNIVFGKGQYQPTSSEGKKLLAHELVHTVQQNNKPQVIQRRVVCDEWGANCKSVPDEPEQSYEGKSDSGNNSGTAVAESGRVLPKLSFYQNGSGFESLAIQQAQRMKAIGADSFQNCERPPTKVGAIVYDTGRDIINAIGQVNNCYQWKVSELHFFGHSSNFGLFGRKHPGSKNERRGLYADWYYDTVRTDQTNLNELGLTSEDKSAGAKAVRDIPTSALADNVVFVFHGCNTALELPDAPSFTKEVYDAVSGKEDPKVFGHYYQVAPGQTRDWKGFSKRKPQGEILETITYHQRPFLKQ